MFNNTNKQKYHTSFYKIHIKHSFNFIVVLLIFITFMNLSFNDVISNWHTKKTKHFIAREHVDFVVYLF